MPSYDFDIELTVPSEELADFFRAEWSQVFPYLSVSVDADASAVRCIVNEDTEDLDIFFEIANADYVEVFDDIEWRAGLTCDVRLTLTEASLHSSGVRGLSQFRKMRRIERRHERSRQKKARAKARKDAERRGD